MGTNSTIDDVLAGRARWALVLGDCMPILSSMPDAAVAHVITDPPYDEHTHKNARCDSNTIDGVAQKPTGVSFAALPDARGLAPTLVRVSKRWAVAFCTVEDIGAYRDGAGKSWVRSGVWDRVNPSPQLTGDRPGQAVEGIALMHRAGKKRWNRGGGAAIWRFSVDRGIGSMDLDGRPEHDTPKPVGLMLALVSDFSDAGEVVLDPFAGSGSTMSAAEKTGRRAYMIELDPKFCDVIRDRWEKLNSKNI